MTVKRNAIYRIISAVLIMCSAAIPVQADWSKDSLGNWNWVTNGQKAVGWKKINNKWYYFESNGKMKTGWLKDNNKWYCFADDGHMFVGWICYSKKWYYMNSDGTMQTGWFKDNNKDYYLGSDGVMRTGTVIIDGKSYTFDGSGALISGTAGQQISENTSDTVKPESNSGSQSLNEPVQNLTNVTDPNIFVNSGVEYTIIKDEDSTNNNSNGNNDDLETDKENDDEKFSYDNSDLKDSSLDEGVIRTEAPDTDNKCYYSDLNIFYKAKLSPPFSNGDTKIVGNCTWYAWGRIFELTGKAPVDAGFTGNAYEWWEANKKNKKYEYGSEPKVGALAVWKPTLAGSNGCGHVAVIEKIEDGKVYISESAWHGALFKYKEIYSTDDLYGFIYVE